MRLYSGILLTLALCWLSACGSADERVAEEAAVPEAVEAEKAITIGELPNNENQITGILQTSGLQSNEQEALGLNNGNYQLIAQNAYFLEGHDSLGAYLGQCVTLAGQLRPLAEEREPEEQFTYNRRIFDVEEVSLQLFSYCHFSDTTARQPQGREVTYTGLVERMERPAPDIAYDYQLRLQQPYRDANHPVIPGKMIEVLPLVTADFSVLSALETALQQDHTLQLKGIQHQGYAEREAIWVQSAESLSL